MDFKETISKLGIENEEAVNALSELFQQQQDEITKLNQVKENLFEDKAKWKTEREEALSEAEKIRNEALRKAGDFETLEANLKAQHESEMAKYKDMISQKDSLILGKQNDAVINDLAGKFIDPNIGKVMLKNLVTTSYSESGEVVTSLNGLDGQSLTTDMATFAEKLQSIEGFSSVLKGVDSSGGGANGSQGGGGAPAKDTTQSRLSERLREKGLVK